MKADIGLITGLRKGMCRALKVERLPNDLVRLISWENCSLKMEIFWNGQPHHIIYASPEGVWSDSEKVTIGQGSLEETVSYLIKKLDL